MNDRILFLGIEENTYEALKEALKGKLYEVHYVSELKKAMDTLHSALFNVAVVDITSPEINGLLCTQRIKDLFPDIFIVVLTDPSGIVEAVYALRNWANDYLIKPFNAKEIAAVVEKNLSLQKMYHENLRLKKEISEIYKYDNILTQDPRMLEILEMISLVAETDSPVLIEGETGTGKELIARAIHQKSDRRNNEFVAINCGALPETLIEDELFGHEKGAFTGAIRQRIGKFEFADKGTLFLDEVESISMQTQVKLLRAIEEKEFQRVGDNETIRVDVRIIAASNVDIGQAVESGRFREDLYYRLNVVNIKVPPLRERKGDIPLLAQNFLRKFRKKLHKDIQTVSEDAFLVLMEYPWPGNIRELANVIERTVIMAKDPVITADEIGFLVNPTANRTHNGFKFTMNESLHEVRKKAVEAIEREYLAMLFKRFKGNIELVAEHSGMTPRGIYKKMKKYGLSKSDFK
jgi:two-component system response regulator AtoC